MNEVINSQISICFYGSSDEGLKSPLAVLHKDTVTKVVADTLELDYGSFQIITGGYGGIMDMVAKEFKKQASLKYKTVEIIGVTCDAYDFENPYKVGYNKSNDFSLANDIIIHAESFPARLQAMIELADVFVVLPGKQGTLTELLITSESYSYSIQMFKEKNVKILVHKYWENLLKNSFWKNLFQKSYFRKLKNIQYFDSKSFIHLLKEFQPTQKQYPFKSSKKSRDHETSDTTQQAINSPIEKEFGDFCKDIERTIYGRIIDEDGLKNRLKFKHGILAIDFGYYLSADSTKTDGGEYLTYSTNTYSSLLADFFLNKNSIMFNETIKESEFEVEYLKGKLGEEEIITFSTKKEIPKPEIKKENSDFKTWKNFLESKQYGQTLLWRSLTNNGNNNSYKLNLSIFLLFNCYLPTRKIEKIRQLTDEFLLSVSTAKISKLFGDKEEKLQSHALQSAVAQVFARNFAHNIGSHVAIRATNRMAKERIAELYKIEKTKFKDNTEIESWLDYMGEKLDLFEVARNEFLAEYKLPAKNVMLYRDVILPFCENTLLMDNIAHSEGIHYKNTCENKLKIKVLINKVEIIANYPQLESYTTCEKPLPIAYSYNFPYLVKPKEGYIDAAFNEKKLVDKNENIISDIEICLSSEHSLYSILENLIRNSAKHNKSAITEEEGLIITINIVDNNDDDYFEIQIYDNVSKVTGKKIEEFAKKILDPLIKEDGEIERKNLGIADIKINAHLLKTDADITNKNLSEALTLIYRQEYDEIIDKDANETKYPKLDDLNNFEIFNKESKCEGDKKIYNFGYQFKLCKPKKVIWIGQKDNPELKKKGIICLKDYTKFKSKYNSSKDKEEPLANYQFAILELEAVKKLTNDDKDVTKLYEWDDFLIKLPHRVLLNCIMDEIKDCVALKELNTDGRIQLVEQKEHKIKVPAETSGVEHENWDFDFLKNCWKNWLRKWGINEQNKGNLMIYLEDREMRKNWDNTSSKILNVYSSSNTIPPNTNILIEKDKTTVIYDHHSAGRNSLKVKGANNITESFKGNYIERDAYFCYDKGSNDYTLLAFPSHKKEEKILFAYEAFEAGLKKIVIADERIADKIPFKDDNTKHITNILFVSKGSKSPSPNLSDLCNNGNIFIVTKINKDIEISKFENCHLTFENNETNNLSLIFCKTNYYNNKIDVLIIHRTFMQKLLENCKDEGSRKKLMNSLYKKFKRVVIVSGGGKPHSMQIPMNFKPFSQLANTMVKYPSKINLNKML